MKIHQAVNGRVRVATGLRVASLRIIQSAVERGSHPSMLRWFDSIASIGRCLPSIGPHRTRIDDPSGWHRWTPMHRWCTADAPPMHRRWTLDGPSMTVRNGGESGWRIRMENPERVRYVLGLPGHGDARTSEQRPPPSSLPSPPLAAKSCKQERMRKRKEVADVSTFGTHWSRFLCLLHHFQLSTIGKSWSSLMPFNWNQLQLQPLSLSISLPPPASHSHLVSSDLQHSSKILARFSWIL